MFSQSIPTLDLIEKLVNQHNWGDLLTCSESNSNSKGDPTNPTASNGVIEIDDDSDSDDGTSLSRWQKGREYLRIDGSIPTSDRQELIHKFNNTKSNGRCSLFLLSTRAGNMGINLQAATRVGKLTGLPCIDI